LRKSERANATAAYEHDDDAMPNPVARINAAGPSSPSALEMASRRTTACTTDARRKPSTSDHAICQAISPDMRSASMTVCIAGLLSSTSTPLSP